MSNGAADSVIIQTTSGPIRGLSNNSIYGDDYFSFEGVPFAQPPLGKLRFKAPVPKQPWSAILDCTKKSAKPLQLNPFTNEVEGDEDCLYLNVYVKKLQSQKPLPIMVFLFGGGFEKGDASRETHAPDYFMMKDIIIITVSYRLAALGFLSLHDASLNIPGNAGLKDQLLALQWINENAANFNGNPHNITLFGESAGAASTHYLMLSPLAKQLFHKAILISGNIYCPWAISPIAELPFRLAQANGFTHENNDKRVLEFLQSLEAADLVSRYFLSKQENLDDCIFTFGPVVEPFDSSNIIIPKDPKQLQANAWGNDIPIVLGGTSFEGLLMFARVYVRPYMLLELQQNPQHLLPLELKRKHDLETQRLLSSKLRQAFFGDKEINMQQLLTYCDYASYKLFWHPILRTVKSRLRHSQAPTYFYRFDFDSLTFNHQRLKYCGKSQQRGVAHVDDHSYVWYGDFSWKLDRDSKEFCTIQRMIEMWTSFAYTSDPNCAKLDPIKWLPVDKEEHLRVLNISEELQVIELPEMEKLKIWNEIFEFDGKN